jgi:hypothetical protein
MYFVPEKTMMEYGGFPVKPPNRLPRLFGKNNKPMMKVSASIAMAAVKAWLSHVVVMELNLNKLLPNGYKEWIVLYTCTTAATVASIAG